MSNCLPDCPCHNTQIEEINERFAAPVCVANIDRDREVTIFGCPSLQPTMSKCYVDVDIPVCDGRAPLQCSVKIYTLTYSGTIHYVVSVPVMDGLTCEGLPDTLTFDIEVDIGEQHCFYCDEPCIPTSCDLVTINNLSVNFLPDSNEILITGQPVFNCPGR
ncbi:hypothetical protein [Bacillus sp. P14.5]|uniref:hypothetical protein n=1 Tax=Bacillus sp. P14.5 TaxID=1983400 RepID=UPI0013B063EB|nr:hypothetical protein [Bacillus sp. P14.5]